MVSTNNTHKSALNRVLGEALIRAYMNRCHVPMLIDKGSVWYCGWAIDYIYGIISYPIVDALANK